MSRIAVVTASPPLTEGGHLVIARSLVSALQCAGHEASVITTPSHPFGRQATAYLATWLTDVTQDGAARPIDRVISLRYPSFAVRHPVHVSWLNHRMREYYDLWPAFSSGLGRKGRIKESVRRALIHRVDRYLLTRNVRRLFAQSKTIQARLARFGGIPSVVLYPPPPPRPYRSDGYGDFLFAVSRLTRLKRLDMLVDALAEPAARGVRAIIAGDGEDRQALESRVRERGLDGRVSLVGAVDTPRLVDYLARCRAVCFAPLDEDYGFVTIEAFASGKPVVTCTDSGGPAELVEDGVNGMKAEPNASSLALAIARVMEDAALAERLGTAALAHSRSITWEATIAALLAPCT